MKQKTKMQMWRFNFFFQFVLITIIGLNLFSCKSNEGDNSSKLQIYSKKEVIDGKEQHIPIPEFEFTNQDGQTVNNATFKNKVYVTDFFFTTCPDICIRMSAQMARLHEAFKDSNDVMLLSHSINPEYDNVDVLKAYSEKLGATSEKWHMVTGERSEIYGMAKFLMVTALEDPKAPGGYAHSGHFILIDKNGLIRGYYDGTDEMEVTILIDNLKTLLKE